MGVSTDIIAGFPGETQDDLQQTLDLIREAEFDNAYVFKYSPRKNTPAATMADQVPADVIEERHARLLGVVNELSAAKLQRMVGRIEEVLVEGPSRKNAARLEGRTGCNKIVVFEGSPRHIGQLMPLRITRASFVILYGDPAFVNLD
jgi:tRNA-2-methylthio-N6-dimethylallyladenosine synthase